MQTYDEEIATRALACASENFARFKAAPMIFDYYSQPKDGACCGFTADVMSCAFANPDAKIVDGVAIPPSERVPLSRLDSAVSTEMKLVAVHLIALEAGRDIGIGDHMLNRLYEDHVVTCFRISENRVAAVDSYVHRRDLEIRLMENVEWAEWCEAVGRLARAPPDEKDWQRVANLAVPEEGLPPLGYDVYLRVFDLDLARARERMTAMLAR